VVLMVGAEQLVIRNTFEHLLMIRRRTGDKFFFIVNKKKIILSSSLRLAMRSAFTRPAFTCPSRACTACGGPGRGDPTTAALICYPIFCNLKGIRFPLLPAGPKPAAAAVFRRSYLGMGLIPALMRKESDGIRCKSEMKQISEIRKTKKKSPDSNQFSNFKSFCAHFDGRRLLCLVCDQVII